MTRPSGTSCHMKVGLVLGAGGTVGAAWLIGALDALADETGWDPRSADRIVGTSAGSVVGAMLAGGLEPALMGAYLGGELVDEAEDAEARAVAHRAADFRPQLGLPPIGPGSLGMAVSALRRVPNVPPSVLVAGLLPRGFISTKPIQRLVQAFVGDGWVDHPGYAAVAADYGSGRRTAFGMPGTPPTSAARAVAASCAIPGFYCPVPIADRKYVDGGICSMSNLDLLRGADLDLVVCLNPTSSLAAVAGGSPVERLGGLMRGAAGRRLGHEARKLRESGTEVLLLQPDAEDVAAMGLNMMARDRREAVLEQARRSMALQLRRCRDEGLALPGRPRRARRAQAAPAAA
jgi:NTE family protein